jgi:hypothetical protein
MVKEPVGAERRKFVRVAEEDLLTCELFDALALEGVTKKRIHAFTKTLSEGGILFESTEAFDMGAVLKLQIDIPGWEKYKLDFYKGGEATARHPLVALGKVVRVEDVGGGLFDIGVAFVALDSGHKLALKKYLHEEKPGR